MTKRSRAGILCSIMVLMICVCMLATAAFASEMQYFDLETSGATYDIGVARAKDDYSDAQVFPTNGKNYGNGCRFFIRQVSSTNSSTSYLATGYTDRFNLSDFVISYKPSYAKPGQVRMGMYSYTQSANYSVQMDGKWYP